MTKVVDMSDLYNKLSQFGLPKQYIKQNALPNWWDNELDTQPVAVLEGAGYIAKRLGLDLKSLLTEEELRFKQRLSNKNNSDIALGIAQRIAEMVAYGCKGEFSQLPKKVQQIREEILATAPTVNLNSLLDYCWNHGIIVIHFANFPPNLKKFDGIIQNYVNSPVILIAANHKIRSKLAFILAHELGHLALGHLQDNLLIDNSINPDSLIQEEKEANEFAERLLLGNCDCSFKNQDFKSDSVQYACSKASENKGVEPSMIILSYAWHHGDWKIAGKALKDLDSKDGTQIINQKLAQKINWDKFDNDTYEYLEFILGV